MRKIGVRRRIGLDGGPKGVNRKGFYGWKLKIEGGRLIVSV